MGLKLEIFIGQPDTHYRDFLHEWYYNAINVYVSEQRHLPIDKYGRPFRAGSLATFKLSLLHHVNLPPPYSDCQYADSMDTEITNAMRNLNMPYYRYNCISFCQQKLTYDQSGCYYMTYPNIFNLSLCHTFNQTKYNHYLDVDDSVCPSQCPAECEEYLYDFEVSYSDYPSVNNAHKIIQNRHSRFARLFGTANVSYDVFKQSVARFHFYFDELVVTEIIESPSLSEVDFVSNLGNFFGLFLGLSVMSFVELFDLAISIPTVVVNHYKSKIRDSFFIV